MTIHFKQDASSNSSNSTSDSMSIYLIISVFTLVGYFAGLIGAIIKAANNHTMILSAVLGGLGMGGLALLMRMLTQHRFKE